MEVRADLALRQEPTTRPNGLRPGEMTWGRGLELGLFMKTLQGRLDKHANLISSVVFCIGLLIPSLPLEAQSSKASTSGQTKHPILDSSFDPLHQVSTSLQLLSKRVSPSVVQIFSTGYSPDSDREHRNTDLLSRGVTPGSGIILASDGWIVTKLLHVNLPKKNNKDWRQKTGDTNVPTRAN